MSAGQRIKSYLRHPLSLTLALLVCLAALITVCMLVFIVVYILAKGIPYLTPSLFELEYTTENVSLFPAIVTTIEMTLLSLLIAAPLGILTAVYLVEYAKRGNKLVGLVRGLDDGETVAFLHYLLVDPAYQGQHIGQELMERILEKYKHMLHVKIMPSDPKTIPFYERFGFVAGGSYTAMELNQMQ